MSAAPEQPGKTWSDLETTAPSADLLRVHVPLCLVRAPGNAPPVCGIVLTPRRVLTAGLEPGTISPGAAFELHTPSDNGSSLAERRAFPIWRSGRSGIVLLRIGDE